MKLFRSLKICFAVILLSVPLSGFAQYKFEIRPFMSYLRDARRWELGGTYMFTTGTFNGVIPIYGFNNHFLGDTTVKRNIYSKPGFGGSLGVTVPFAALGHISCFALSIHLMGNYFQWEDLNKTYNLDGTFKTAPYKMNGKTIQLGLPVGIDYKVGCDAIATKRLKFGASLGAGVLPHVNITSIDSVNDAIAPEANIGFNPYVKAEGAIFIGICVKVRAMYTMGNVELINSGKAITGYTDGPFKITNNSHMMFSLIIMPFSYKWRETAWYNDYDSYNWNEKLN
ncbi:MAG: hypothetical protein H7257_12040 [Taibaiella sp.]|nr:hypothetical protein [Taibaiella sp.]